VQTPLRKPLSLQWMSTRERLQQKRRAFDALTDLHAP
jgi:hypothetical protein